MIEKTEKEIMKNWQGDISNPVVSICCITYNHEQYISEAINSFLMQETNFPFEIVIGEDCSTDNTRKIVEKYKEMYPNIIKLIVSENNVGAQANLQRTMEACIGEYIAGCEGDDYWTDKNKLQIQKDFLENNKNISLVFTPAKQIQDGKKDFIRNEYNIKQIGKIDTAWVIKKGGGFYPSCSVMIRKELFDNLPNWFYKHSTGDYPLAILASLKGKIAYLNECTSVYRSQPNSVSHIKESDEKIEQKCKNNIEFFEMLKNNNTIDEKLKKEMIKKEIYMKISKTKKWGTIDLFKIGLKNMIKLILKELTK